MADDTDQQPPPQAQPDLNAAIQALIQQQLRVASGQGQQVQLPSAQPPPSQYSNDPSQGPDLLGRIGLALGGGALPGAPAELRAQMGRQALLNFGIGLMSAGRFSTPGEVLAGGLRGAQAGLLGSEATQAAQQEYALNAQAKLAELGLAQQKNRTEALQAVVPLLQMQGRLGLPPLFGPGSEAGPPGGGGGGGGGPALTGDIDKDQQIIAQRESGGDPTALNYVARADPTAYGRGATASGKYQFVNSTWQEGLKLAGVENPGQYPTAMSAPEAVQDQVFRAVYGKYGTAPWDPSKFKQTWVPTPTGQFILAHAVPPSKTAAAAPSGGPGGGPVGPVKVAGGEAPPGAAPPSSALPVPPVPPSGAVPSVSTPEEASATAKAAGTPVQVPGGEGLWAKPEGGVTTTPRLIMPGTAVASVTPTAPTLPPTGPITPPPAAQPPPAAPAQPAAAQPPPAAQPQPPARAPDVTARNDDGTYVVPNDKLSLPDYQQRYRHVPTADELTQRGLVIPGNEAEVQAAARGVQEAEAAAQAAQTAANRAQAGYTGYGTVADLLKANTEAQAKAQDARQKYAEMLQDTTKTNAAALQSYYNKQDTDLAANYKAEVLDPRNAAALEAQRQQGEINKDINLQVNQQWGKIIEQAQKNADTARNVRDQLEPSVGLLSEQPTNAFVRNMLDHDTDGRFAATLKGLGIADPMKVDARTQLNGILAYVATEMKPTGLGALRVQEMNAIRGALGSGSLDPATQRLMLARILNLQDRTMNEADAAGELWQQAIASGKPGPGLGTVQKDIDAKLGPVIHNAATEMSPADLADPAKVNTWMHGAVAPNRPVYVPKYDKSGQLVRDANGNPEVEMKVTR